MAKAMTVPAVCPDAPLRVNATLPLLTRLAEVLQFDPAVRDPDRVHELHDMRIAVKRLRYTLEILAAAVPGSGGFLKSLKALQDYLGEMHDADVLAPRLEKDMAADGETPGVRALLERTVADRKRLFGEFIAFWDGLLQEEFPQRLQQGALDAGRLTAAPGPLQVRPGMDPGAEAALASAIALLRLVPYVPNTGPDRRERVARRVQALLHRPEGEGLEGLESRAGKLARALREAMG